MIGIDLVYIPKIEEICQKNPQGFISKAFSLREQKDLGKKLHCPQSLAGRFAAKEAIAKACGLGLGKMGLKEIEVLSEKSGKVYGLWKDLRFSLSISHHGDYAISVATSYGCQKKVAPQALKDIFPYPKPTDHKGSRGKLAIAGGRRGMLGSVLLSSQAAMRGGVGYCYILSRPDTFEALSARSLEVIVSNFSTLRDEALFLKGVDAIAIGPGLGKDLVAKRRFASILSMDKPLVIDADALGLLVDYKEALSKRKNFTILSPHEGEMARLLGISVVDLHNDRKNLTKNFAKFHNCLVVLKGDNTIVSDGKEVYVNSTGNAGMATAGSGDVLTGILGAFLAQGLGAMDGAKLAVYVHGLSGDLAAEELSMNGLIARDLIQYLPKALGHFY